MYSHTIVDFAPFRGSYEREFELSHGNVSVKSKLQHTPPGKPRVFDTFAVPGRREFDYQSLPGGGELISVR